MRPDVGLKVNYISSINTHCGFFIYLPIFSPTGRSHTFLPIYLFAYFTYLLKQIVVIVGFDAKRLFCVGQPIFQDNVSSFAFFDDFVKVGERVDDKFHAL